MSGKMHLVFTPFRQFFADDLYMGAEKEKRTQAPFSLFFVSPRRTGPTYCTKVTKAHPRGQ
jgi:hypothetical protein